MPSIDGKRTIAAGVAAIAVVLAFAACDLSDPAGCVYEGVHFGVGDVYRDRDTCTVCSCVADGKVECLLMPCPDAGIPDASTSASAVAGEESPRCQSP